LLIIYFYILPLLAARAILNINYTVLIHSINIYSHRLDRLFFLMFLNFPSYKVHNHGLLITNYILYNINKLI
ncbi:uncharacterized protein CLUP02_14484, partial [Colletotrichum lupini]